MVNELLEIVKDAVIDHESEHGSFHDPNDCECGMCDFTVIAYPAVFGYRQGWPEARTGRALYRLLQRLSSKDE